LSEPPLDCSISAFGGIEDTGETSDLIESWSVQTRSCFSIQMLPGDHFFVYTSQQILLEMLAHELQQVVK
jgi:medium-chain acyl-[acyl-carrier-protein] hydrolase